MIDNFFVTLAAGATIGGPVVGLIYEAVIIPRLNQRVVDLKAHLQDTLDDLDKAEDEGLLARSEVRVARMQADGHRKAWEAIRPEQLRAAQDARDPRTGRFTKKQQPPQYTQPSAMDVYTFYTSLGAYDPKEQR